MVSARGLQLLSLACLVSLLPTRADDNHLVIAPQSPVLEIGTNFTATCLIINTAEVTADDLYWNLSKTTVSKEQYIKINSTALNVTIPITTEKPEWLFCLCKRVSPHVVLNYGKFIHGIFLVKGYRPEKPVNLSCKAVQEDTYISPVISCKWEAEGRHTAEVPIKYTLFVKHGEITKAFTSAKSAEVHLNVFPNFMPLEIWVEAENQLGTVESEHLMNEANSFVETNPPSGVQALSEKSFPTCLLIHWTHPIHMTYLRLTYQIRYCQLGSHVWTYVPLADTDKYIESFRLQNLRPDTEYVIQVCCKNSRKGHGYWSNWSTNATEKTPEDRPGSKPDLWIIVADDGMNGREVQFISKDPELANGRITRFDIMIQNQDSKDKVKNGSREWEHISVNKSERITLLKKIPLTDNKSVKVHVTAINSVGKSQKALLVIPKTFKFAPVEELMVRPHEGQLSLEWKPPNNRNVSEYVVDWVSDNQLDWQRESGNTTHTFIKADLKKFFRYKVSVWPIYSGRIGKPAHAEAFLEQAAPERGPPVRLSGSPGRNDAKLIWEEIPQHQRRGFITNYTIFYTSGGETHVITVPANTTSYTLTSLSANTKYDTFISASTIRGSTNGTNHSFITLKYAPGEIEGIVVGVSLGFLFVVLMAMLICIYKKDLIKKNFWPEIPNPGESTIGNWSPDYPLKAETPKENCLSGISVLNMDICDGKCVIEDDKASLPLKKDKYLSEEHSSGIGGSSCMSSPRQSVSDSDEGGDMADTTSSTIQYSSVVASSGYKGQTPSSHPQQSIFSRSESTQPLLDSEESADMLVQDGSRQFQHFSRQPSDWLSTAPVSSYMPQLGGYRPQ
uniref:Interleukin-6 receptor subunit beta-like n=1 Tax=Stegastes partitus TaxID=144197 RepID=A0A3B4ZST1_9TELE